MCCVAWAATRLAYLNTAKAFSRLSLRAPMMQVACHRPRAVIKK